MMYTLLRFLVALVCLGNLYGCGGGGGTTSNEPVAEDGNVIDAAKLSGTFKGTLYLTSDGCGFASDQLDVSIINVLNGTDASSRVVSANSFSNVGPARTIDITSYGAPRNDGGVNAFAVSAACSNCPSAAIMMDPVVVGGGTRASTDVTFSYTPLNTGQAGCRIIWEGNTVATQ